MRFERTAGRAGARCRGHRRACHRRQAVKIGFITKFPVPFFATMEDAAKAYAAANPGVEIIYGQGAVGHRHRRARSPSSRSMVTKGVQGIALTPVDPTVAPALDKAIVAAGIKIVLMDNNIPDWTGRTALATTNNYDAGVIAGQPISKTVLKDGDTLGILEGVPGVPALDDRVNGMLEGLEARSKVEVVGKGATNCTEELGINVAEDLLTAIRTSRRSTPPAVRRPPVPPRRSRMPASPATPSSWWASTSAAAKRQAIDVGHRRRDRRAVPGQDGRARRRCAGQGHPWRDGPDLIDSGAALVTKDNMAQLPVTFAAWSRALPGLGSAPHPAHLEQPTAWSQI